MNEKGNDCVTHFSWMKEGNDCINHLLWMKMVTIILIVFYDLIYERKASYKSFIKWIFSNEIPIFPVDSKMFLELQKKKKIRKKTGTPDNVIKTDGILNKKKKVYWWLKLKT